MKEKDAETSPSPRYMSPIVKQDLARLNKDTESRRSAMSSLKHFVENLDPGSMPRFLAQVSEIRDQGSSKTHAISLYEDVARVHGKLIIPHIPRVMATVTRSLSSSGSSPQLHRACAKVVSAIAKHSIDDSSTLQADEILREMCDPLLEVLAGKLEPLAAGAAVCLQAVVESGKWGNASDELVNEACLRTAVAMGEKGTRTVAHMQLTCTLATTNPRFMSVYGVPLLRAGVDILRLTQASSTWQQRSSAAHLLQVVLQIVDRATTSSELGPTIQALDSCKHDRMPIVRTAVSEALKTAKALLLEDNSRRNGDDASPIVMLKGRQGRSFNPIEDSVLTSSREQEGDILAQDEEVFSNGGTTFEIEVESDTSSSRDSIHSVSSRISTQSEQSTMSQIGTGRESLGSFSVSGSARSRGVLSGPTMKNVFELKGPVSASIAKTADQPVRPPADEEVMRPPDDFPGNDCKETMDALSSLRAHYNSMAHLRSMEDPYSPQKPKALITAEDFLPYSTPRRLVRSLQSALSSPDSGSGSVGDQDVKSTGEVIDMADMDLETSSEAGWSVRDNPIASDYSFKTDSDEEDSGRNVCKTMTADVNRDTFAPSEGNATSEALERITDSVLGPVPSGLISVNKSSSPKEGRVTKPEEDVEIIKRTQQEGISTSYSQSLGGLRSLLAEDCTYDCSCGVKDFASKLSEGEAICKDVHDSDIMSPRGLFMDKVSMVISGRVGDFISKSWRSVRSYAEVFLGGSLLVVLALPFAMAMSKILLSRPELPGLVPT